MIFEMILWDVRSWSADRAGATRLCHFHSEEESLWKNW